MPSLARAFAWSGRILVSSTLLGCAGCLAPGGTHDTQDSAAFFAEALQATPVQRQRLWTRQRQAPDGSDRALRLALLQSLPGHSGYAPEQAQRRLQALAQGGDADAALARLRLDELAQARACSAEQARLQRKLWRLVDIEHTLDEEGHERPTDSAR
ncbi:hypothetical protein SAMN04488038_101388 [Solimonas aquatica]|uniref:Uncharacterized protein n=1 Tax=Solimonas aquatica TaxID=489703 RepID=A0A1H9AFJ5_9GAMM|nr:hypothetical protein SAMN04488038_101388 [Solimonas aquatica]